ncbi:MAG TPA: efflux RND transporter periplasmic adaptor subunit [Polyangiaceae bacterium]|nr:efflux RND transporter periplasmic adaptor subunit [Polyangiaceae bacterium]
MSFKQRLKSHVSTLVLGTLLVGVAAYEWKQVRTGQVISAAQAKSAPELPQNVLAEGRVAVPPGAEITVGAELNGKLVRLWVKELDTVKAGDVLAEVDVKEQQAALNEAWARVKEAGADVDFTSRERRRSQQLWNSNVVAAATHDRSVHDSTAAESRRTSLLAGAARISANIAKSKIVAPIDGTVTQRFADAGEMVAAGAPLVTVTDLSHRRVEAEVGEFDVARVRIGADVTIRAEGYEQRWRGKVAEIPDRVVPRALKALDPSRPVDTRVLLVKIELSEPVPLKLGQRVEVEVAR